MDNDCRGKMPREVMCPTISLDAKAFRQCSKKSLWKIAMNFIACFLQDSRQFASPQPHNLNGVVVATISLVHELLFMVAVRSRIVEPSARRSPSGFLPDVLTSKEINHETH